MIELKVPFYDDIFLNHKQYREARQKHLEEQFIDKEVIFDCELISVSGMIIHQKGEVVKIRAIDCDCFKISTLDGEPIYGLFKPTCFNLKD